MNRSTLLSIVTGRRSPSVPLAYGLAIVSVVAVFLFKRLLDPIIEIESPFLLFLTPVLVSAWYGGFGPGLLATALAALTVDYFFLAPFNSFLIGTLAQGLRMALFLFNGLVVSGLSEVHHRARVQLRASDERYRELVENANDLIYTLDLEGNLTSINKTGEAITGYTREELLYQPVIRLIAPEYHAPMQQMLTRKMEGEARTRYELELIAKNGQRRVLEVNSQLMTKRGQPVGIQGIARDITERKRAAERAATLQRLTASFSEAITVEQVANVVIGEGLKALQAHNGLLLAVDEANTQLHLISAYRVDAGYLERNRTVPLDGPFLIHDTIRTGQPHWIETPEALAERYPQSFDSIYGDGARAVASLPFIVEGKIIGGMNVTFATPRTFSPDDQAFMMAVAQQCAQALERARLYEAQRHQRKVAEALRDMTVAINSTLNLNEVLERILSTVNQVVPHDASVILLLENEIARVGSSHGFDSHRRRMLESLEFQAAGTTALREMIQSGQPLIIPDMSDYPDWVHIPGDDDNTVYHAFIGAPIFLRQEIIGFLNLFGRSPGFFNQAHAERLRLLAEPVATAIQNARLYEQARELAIIEERQRLARELHDAVSQTLFSANVLAESLPRLWKRQPERVVEKLDELSQLTRGASAEMRTLLLELRPAMILKTSLGELLEQLCRAVQGRKKIRCSLDVDEQDPQGIPQDIHVALYRIAQESLNNIVKHSQATEVAVHLRSRPDAIELRITDNGHGFDLKTITSGFGLGNMHERARDIGASLEVHSATGQGTQVTIAWIAPREAQASQ